MMGYNFATGPDHDKSLIIWKVVKQLTPNGLCRSDRVLMLLNRGVLLESEAMMVIAWLNCFQTEDFAQ